MASAPDLTAGGLLRRSVDLLRAHPLPLLLPPVLLSLLTGGGNQGGPRYDASAWSDPAAFDPLDAIPFYALVATIATIVLVALVVAALLIAIIVIATAVVYTATSRALLDHLATGEDPDFSVGFRTLQGRWPRLGWTLFVAGVLVILGLIALIVPGVILLSGFLALFAVLANESVSGPEALRRAWDITKGRKGSLAALVVGGVLVEIVVGATLGWIPFLGWIVSGLAAGAVAAVWLCAGAIVYRAATAPEPASPPAPSTPPAPAPPAA